MPNQTDDWSCGIPASAVVGTSGSAEERRSESTAIGRTLPALTWPTIPVISWNMSWVRPATRSLVASPTFAYGTCCICVPLSFLYSSPERCIELPLPDEPKLSFPGFALT